MIDYQQRRGRPRIVPYGEPGRTHTNWHYMWAAYTAIAEAASKITYTEAFSDDIANKWSKLKCRGVLEQLGRMKLQDNYDSYSVIHIADSASKLRRAGWKSRDIENWVRQSRPTCDFTISVAASEKYPETEKYFTSAN